MREEGLHEKLTAPPQKKHRARMATGYQPWDLMEDSNMKSLPLPGSQPNKNGYGVAQMQTLLLDWQT